MSKEDSFRAWDKVLKEMKYWSLEDIWSSELMPEFSEYIIMQYTNIKDRDLKKIFHHDIVKVYGHSKYDPDKIVHDLGYVFWDERELTWIVKIPLDGGAEFEKLSKFYSLPDYIEVIGNLYENPELLEVN